MNSKEKIQQMKEMRKKAGLTQQEMSELLNIPRKTIENWEQGVRILASWVLDLVIDKLKDLSK